MARKILAILLFSSFVGCATTYYARYDSEYGGQNIVEEAKSRPRIEELIREKVKSGESVNVPDDYGATLLGSCLTLGCSDEAFKLLKDAKADPHQPYTTYLCKRQTNFQDRKGLTESDNCQPDLPIFSCISGSLACKTKDEKNRMLDHLFDMNVNLDSRDQFNQSILCALISKLDEESVAFKFFGRLLKSGAKPGEECYDTGSGTALHSAMSKGWFQIAELLVQNGANINAQDGWGHTPLMEWVKDGGSGETTLPKFVTRMKNKIAINAINQIDPGETALDICIARKGYDSDQCNQIRKLGGKESKGGRLRRLAKEKESGQPSSSSASNASSQYTEHEVTHRSEGSPPNEEQAKLFCSNSLRQTYPSYCARNGMRAWDSHGRNFQYFNCGEIGPHKWTCSCSVVVRCSTR
ncbi:MAG: ankyrin repeat domain-containing protein [Spirochaetota bacterium]